MKKTSIFIISIVMLMIGYSSVSFAYSDTSEHWAKDVIDEMSDKKIINGYLDNTFKPNNSMTRAEFIAIVNRLLGLKAESTEYIADVSRQDWYYSDVRKAVEAGIIKGDLQGYIRPNDKITREEAVVILARAFKVTKAASIGVNFNDKDDVSDWAKDDVYTFAKYGYLTGYSDNSIRPKAEIKRAEALTIIKRIIPNILTENIYDGIIKGNTILYDNNIVLNKVTITGNLIVKAGVIDTLKLNKVEVQGNLIIEEQSKKSKEIKVNGKVIEIYEKEKEETTTKYINSEYGISFALPLDTQVVDLNKGETIDFTAKDVVAIKILKDDEYYLKNVLTIGNSEVKKYANLFIKKEQGEFQNAKYVFYDDNEKSQMIVIKRENVVYVIALFNIVTDNFVDNILSTMQLIPTDSINDYEDVIYNNKALSLKFAYRDYYVLIDDSYNTGVINEDTAFFKLFIQVNTVTDMQQYTFKEIKSMLKSLVKNDGKITKTEEMKVVNNDAVKFTIKSEDRVINSLYIIVGNNLYNLIFTGEIEGMNEIGEELFNNIINTIEF